MTDDPAAKVFDMPHARVTLTPVGPNVEIEVWPKAGQSAFAVVSPGVAVLIARQLVELAAAQLSPDQVMAAVTTGLDPEHVAGVAQILALRDATGEAGDAAPRTPEPGTQPEPEPPSNIVHLASRRPKRGGTPA